MTKWEKFFDEKIKEIAKGKIVYDVGGAERFQKRLLILSKERNGWRIYSSENK